MPDQLPRGGSQATGKQTPAVFAEQSASAQSKGKKRKRKQIEEEDAAEVECAEEGVPTDSRPAKRKAKSDSTHVDENESKEATNKVDWAARKKAKLLAKRDRLASLDDKAKAALKTKLEEQAARASKNKALKQKGQMTKKEKYLAAKAAKKAAAQGQKGHSEQKPFNLDEALSTLNLKKLDPKATVCFLSGLPYSAREAHIAKHFASIGHCTVQLLRDQATAKPNGMGFVTFATAEHAIHACTYSGSTIQGRWIKVRLSEPRDSGAMVVGEKPEGCLSVVIKCDKTISEASLKRFFQDCQPVNVSCMTDWETGESRGMAFMDFEDTAMVDQAVLKNGHTIKGLPLYVRYKMEKKGSSRPGVAAHNRAAPVPPPEGKRTILSESDSE